ncbi:hypothetical protein [Formosa haliotis]|uniref:hypothetical protein n=1 Tax=Formosa haliotis TaxID=1555194 RepID=UPI00082686E2|nr:hypothetical protein [Formosa haliotis]
MKTDKLTFHLFMLCFILCTTKIFAQPNTTLALEDSNQQVIDLSGMRWRFKMMAPGEGVKKACTNYQQKTLKL